MTVPFVPTPFAQPVINPSVGGFGVPVPYVSVSEYTYAPTAMDVSSLVTPGDTQDQNQSLYDTIRRASRWADRICFGIDASSKGASLCATQSVEQAYVKVLQGELRLVCAYKPIIEVDGINVGANPGNTQPLSAQQAGWIRIGEKVIYVPNPGGSITVGGLQDSFPGGGYGGWGNQRVYAVWSYVNGYPHTTLAEDCDADSSTVVLTPTNASGGLYGVCPGSQLTIPDGNRTESFVVDSLSDSTITTLSPLEYSHEVPEGPDFLPVTALPEDVTQAVIFLTTALIKTRGDNSLVLDEITEPDHLQSTADAVESDVKTAMAMLNDFRVVSKTKA